MKNLLTVALLITLCFLSPTSNGVAIANQTTPALNGAWRGTFETTAFTVTMDLALTRTGSQWNANVKFSQDAREETPVLRDLKVPDQQIAFGVLLAGMELKFAGALAGDALGGNAEGFRDGAKIGDGKWQLIRVAAPVAPSTKTVTQDGTQAGTQSGDNDTEAIKQVIQRYLDVTEKKNAEAIKQAFHPDTKLLSVGRNGLNQLTLDEWWGRVSRIPGQVTRKGQVTVLDVSGLAAIVKIDFGASKDYVSLLKINGVWKIVNKILSTSLY